MRPRVQVSPLRPSSEQSPLCSGVFLCLWQKRRHPPAALLLLSKSNPLTLGFDLVFVFNHARRKSRARNAVKAFRAVLRPRLPASVDGQRGFSAETYPHPVGAGFHALPASDEGQRGCARPNGARAVPAKLHSLGGGRRWARQR